MADWYQKHVDEWLAARAEGRGRQKNIAILVHRGVGKTTMFTRAGQLWLHVRDPEMSSYTGAEKTELSIRMLRAITAIMDGSDPHALFTKLYGNWESSGRTWGAKEIVHAARKNTSRQDPSMGIFGVETSIVGAHPDAIFYDDPISYERLNTDQNWLQTVNDQITSLFPVIQSDGLVVFVGTRYDEDDHFGIAFREEGVASVSGMQTDSIPIDPEGKWHVYFLCGRDENGEPTTPKVWPEQELTRYQKRDPLRYASQVMNDPAISELNPLNREQIRQCVVPAKEVPWSALRYAILCDLALAGDTKVKMSSKDETVFEVVGYPRNGSGDVYWIEGYGSKHWRAEDLTNRLVALVQRYRSQGRTIFAMTNEVPMSGLKGTWKLVLQNRFHDVNERMPNLIEFDRRAAKKLTRLETAAKFWVDGHVRIVEGAPGAERLMDQMAKIGQYKVNPKIDIDWADAAADMFQPELYQPMRRPIKKAPWDPTSRLMTLDDLDYSKFNDDEKMPRAPIREDSW